MKELIKRPYVAYLSNKEVVEGVLAGTLFSGWYDEVEDKNGFLYRFSAQLHSIVQDVLREQLLLFSEFMYDKLDVTEGSYAINVHPEYGVALDQIRFRATPRTDHLIGDVYLMGRVIKDLGQEEQGDIDRLRSLFSEGRFQVITLDDINQIDTSTQRDEQIANGLEDGEVLLSGEVVAATNRGRIVSFNLNESAFLTSAPVSTFETLMTGLYVLLDPLAIRSTVKFYDNDGELIDVPAEDYIIGLIETSSNYTDFYDEDKDGFISQEDIQQLNNRVGISIDDVAEDVWAKSYAKFDRGNKGRIVQADVEGATALQGAVRETALVVQNPIVGPVFVRYEAYIEPYVTYATPERRVPGGTLGLTDILDQNLDIRIADGFAINSNNYVIGVSLSRNEVWFGRQTETQYALRKISYPHQSSLHVKGFTFMDDVAFLILQSVDGFLYKDLYNVCLLRIDTLREVVEVSTDIVPIKGALIEPTETITGCSITDRKDTIRFFTNFGQIVTVRLERATLTLTPNGSPVVTPDLAGEIPEDRLLNNVKLFNAIDNYAFNVGLTRIPFESNENLLLRIKRRVSRPYLSGLEQITQGTASALGTWKAPIYSQKVIDLWNVIDPNSPVEIKVKKVSNSAEAVLILSPFTQVFTKVAQNQFIGTSVANVATESLSTSFYQNEDGDIFEGKKLILGRATVRRLIETYLRTNPKSVLKAPNLDEELVYVEGLPIDISYSTVDADDVFHGDITESYTIDLPSIDSMKYYTDEVEAMGATQEKPLHLASKGAELSVGYYALHDKLSRYFFGDEHWNSIVQYIRSLDKSDWRRTEPGLSGYDERYASGNIVRESQFNQGEFNDVQIEVAL